MINLIWKDKLICQLTEEEVDTLLLVLPYWGLELNETTLIPSLLEKKLHLACERSDYAYSLMELVRHTGIEATPIEENSDIMITMAVSKHLDSPLSVLMNAKKVRPKALHAKSLDLQKRIHKNAWLPVSNSAITCVIKEDDHITAIEWLSYMIIQYFMKSSFKPIHHIPIDRYEKLVTTVLEKVNPTLSLHQKTTQAHSDWPDVPNQMKTEIPKKKDLHPKPINPFSDAHSLFDPIPFDPFKFNHTKRKTSVINPFHQKRSF